MEKVATFDVAFRARGAPIPSSTQARSTIVTTPTTINAAGDDGYRGRGLWDIKTVAAALASRCAMSAGW